MANTIAKLRISTLKNGFLEGKRTKMTIIGSDGWENVAVLHLLDSIAKDFDYKTGVFAAKK